MKITPFVDENNYDHISQIYYCGGGCAEPLEVREHPVKDYTLCVWKHFGFIAYPAVLATTEKGHTLEGIIDKPARRVLAAIPCQNRVQFCLDCLPPFKQEGCGYCGEPVDTELDHSEVDCLDKYVNGMNANLRTYRFHHNCLPETFDIVKQYRLEHS